MASGGRNRALDGLRALAVLCVLVFHMDSLPGGYLGVDVFFVLSGYLITAQLLAEWDRTGAVSLTRFYLRRAYRLLPAFWLLAGVGAVAVVGLGIGSAGERDECPIQRRSRRWTPIVTTPSVPHQIPRGHRPEVRAELHPSGCAVHEGSSRTNRPSVSGTTISVALCRQPPPHRRRHRPIGVCLFLTPGHNQLPSEGMTRHPSSAQAPSTRRRPS